MWTIDGAIAGVVEEARDQGVDHVVWLSLRTSDDVDYSDPQEQPSINTFREYNEQLVAAAEESDGYLQVADWATYSNGASAWFEADGDSRFYAAPGETETVWIVDLDGRRALLNAGSVVEAAPRKARTSGRSC